MKRRWWIVLGLTVATATGVGVVITEANGDPITLANFEKINQDGVPEKEVIAVLGRCGDDVTYLVVKDLAGEPVETMPVKIWKGRRARIYLALRDNGTVCPVFSSFDEDEMLFGKLRRWWHEAFDPPNPALPR